MATKDEQYTAFVRGLWPRLSRTARMLTRSDADADDALSTALERIYVKWRLVENSASPEAYCLTILTRVVTDQGRRGWLRRTTLTADDTLDRSFPVADGTISSTERLALHQALHQLPERQRMAVVLRYLEDLPVAHVAEIMSVTEGTVKRTCSDGLRNLRPLLEAQHA